MDDRKKKGIGALASGVVSILIGVIFLVFDVTPDWLPTVLALVGAAANVLGFTLVYPDGS